MNGCNQEKRNSKRIRLETDQEFQQKKIKKLNQILLIDMFSTTVCGGKVFDTEQKIRQLKKRISTLKGIKSK